MTILRIALIIAVAWLAAGVLVAFLISPLFHQHSEDVVEDGNHTPQ